MFVSKTYSRRCECRKTILTPSLQAVKAGQYNMFFNRQVLHTSTTLTLAKCDQRRVLSPLKKIQ